MILCGGVAVGGAVEIVKAGIGLLDGGGIEESGGVVPDPWEQAAVEDVAGQRGFELDVADEHDDGMEAVVGKVEELFEGFDVQQVLVKRILKPVPSLVNLLGPLGLFLGTEDPAFVVLGFDHEDPGRGDDDVVDLGAALAIGPRQIDVAEGPIKLRIELLETDAAYHDFAQPALECGTGRDFEDEP